LQLLSAFYALEKDLPVYPELILSFFVAYFCRIELFEINGKTKQDEAVRLFPYRYPFYFSFWQKVVF
jgi:hypothetical protein